LLGSDYTPGVAGVGIVNALEIVSAFPDMDGLCRFKAWVDAPESDLVAAAAARAGGGRRKAQARAGAAPGGSPAGAAGAGTRPADASAASPSPGGGAGAAGGGDEAQTIGEVCAAEDEFKQKHRGKRKNWVLSETFPAQNVVDAYMHPQVERSKQRFEWGRPDDLMLRAFCDGTLGWAPNQVEPLLVSIIREHDAHETQRTMDSFFRPQVRTRGVLCVFTCMPRDSRAPVLLCLHRQQDATEQFAKVRSKRLRNAITGLTGRVDPELALGDAQEAPPKPKRPRKPAQPRKKKAKAPAAAAAVEDNEEEDIADPDGNDGDGNYMPGGGGGAGGGVEPRAQPRRAARATTAVLDAPAEDDVVELEWESA
jgi:DNA excision repair protein ERCC-5